MVRRQLMLRFGPLTAEVEALIASASISELDAIGERLPTAPTLEEALGPRCGHLFGRVTGAD